LPNIEIMAESRIALVTGANRGIGLEVCRQLAWLGHRVILTARDLAKARAAAEALDSSGSVSAAQLDVVDAGSIRALADDLAARGQWIDVLVNNAAVLLDEAKAIVDLPADDLRKTFETNLFAPIAVSQAFVPGMISRGYGRIVNVSSEVGQLGKRRVSPLRVPLQIVRLPCGRRIASAPSRAATFRQQRLQSAGGAS
jgi:NAD(P)-dependent dehydrogenase (short-subunit alcohol dehydrogenase family)